MQTRLKPQKFSQQDRELRQSKQTRIILALLWSLKVKELNRQNNQLRAKYHGDAKYTRIHKRLLERGALTEAERRIFEALTGVKAQADEQVLQNTQLLDNESYFERMMMPLVIGQFQTRQKINLNPDASRYINKLVVNEYRNEFASGRSTGARAW